MHQLASRSGFESDHLAVCNARVGFHSALGFLPTEGQRKVLGISQRHQGSEVARRQRDTKAPRQWQRGTCSALNRACRADRSWLLIYAACPTRPPPVAQLLRSMRQHTVADGSNTLRLTVATTHGISTRCGHAEQVSTCTKTPKIRTNNMWETAYGSQHMGDSVLLHLITVTLKHLLDRRKIVERTSKEVLIECERQLG